MNILLTFLINLIFAYKIIILIRCVFSWIQLDSPNPLIRFIYEITDPLLYAIHRLFPMLSGGGLDFSPMILLFGLHLVENLLRNLV
ncbi:MAG: YggT family protein [bacterium]|nr:YggT family protein [bacterium]